MLNRFAWNFTVSSIAGAAATVALASVAAFPSSIDAQSEAQTSNDVVAGAQISVYLVTVGPGRHVWERFGHNAIWIRDDVAGTNRAYNYGLFSFEQVGFVTRFLQGRMEYWMRGFDADLHLQGYVSDNRSVWVQELNLSAHQKVELRDFLEWNERPENRFYRYHYYYDNCSTRIRDAIDRVLGGTIYDQTKNVFPGHTLRFHSLRLVSNDFWTYTGLLLGLGQPVDEPLSAWDEMFLPLKLREHLRNVEVRGEDGSAEPLVLSERTIYESSEFVEAATPPKWTLRFLTAGLALALVALFAAHKATEGHTGRIVFAAIATAWYALTGLVGLGLAGLWMFTDHNTSYRNENLFWFNPVAIVLVMLVPLLVLRVPWSMRVARLAAVFVAGASLLGVALQIVPGMDQVSGPLIALAVPPNVAFAAGVLWYSSVES